MDFNALLSGVMAIVVTVLIALGEWVRRTWKVPGRYVGTAVLVLAIAAAVGAKLSGELNASWLQTALVGVAAGLAANGAWSLPAAYAERRRGVFKNE